MSEQQYIFIDGIRYNNPRYNGVREDDLSFARSIGCEDLIKILRNDFETDENKTEAAMKVLNILDELPIQGLLTKEHGEKIKKIMLDFKLSRSSLKQETNCPFCLEKDVLFEHFLSHPFMFERGCIFCDTPLTEGDFDEYSAHIEERHPQQYKQ